MDGGVPSCALSGIGFAPLTWALALFPFSTGSPWPEVWVGGPALAPQPSAALCCPQQMAIKPPGPAGPWALMPGPLQ